MPSLIYIVAACFRVGLEAAPARSPARPPDQDSLVVGGAGWRREMRQSFSNRAARAHTLDATRPPP